MIQVPSEERSFSTTTVVVEVLEGFEFVLK